MALIESRIIRGFVALAAVGITTTSCSEPQQSVTTPTTGPSISDIIKTPMPTEIPPSPTETRLVPTPTEIPIISDQLKIETARELQEGAMQKGKFKIPLPEQMKNGEYIGINYINYTESVGSNASYIVFDVLDAGQEVNFPSLMDGTVVDINTKSFPPFKMILIRRGNDYLYILFPESGNLYVQWGEKVEMGKKLFSFRATTDAVIAVLYSSAADGQKKWENLGRENILFDENNNLVTVPTLVE